jgi:hypothetical protein
LTREFVPLTGRAVAAELGDDNLQFSELLNGGLTRCPGSSSTFDQGLGLFAHWQCSLPCDNPIVLLFRRHWLISQRQIC